MPAARLSPAAALRGGRGAGRVLPALRGARTGAPWGSARSRTRGAQLYPGPPRGSARSRLDSEPSRRSAGLSPPLSPAAGAEQCGAEGTADAASSPALGASERSEGSAPGLSPGATRVMFYCAWIPSLRLTFEGGNGAH